MCNFLINFNYIWISFTFFYVKIKYKKVLFLGYIWSSKVLKKKNAKKIVFSYLILK